MLPPDVAAMALIWSNTHWVAAPMPRTGSVWLDKVCLVPNWVSRRIVAPIRSGSTCFTSLRSAGSTLDLGIAASPWGAARAALAGSTIGAATAVAAEAAETERKVRRLGPFGPVVEAFSIATNQELLRLVVKASG
jgi:hypothetical protein